MGEAPGVGGRLGPEGARRERSGELGAPGTSVTGGTGQAAPPLGEDTFCASRVETASRSSEPQFPLH